MAKREPVVMPFDVNAWLSDPEVGLLRPASRAFWFECLLLMWKRGRTGQLNEELTALAKLTRTSLAEARSAIAEIKERSVADVIGDVTLCNSNVTPNVTLVNRRMKREYERRLSVAVRVSKHRKGKRVTENVTHHVTPDVTPVKHFQPPPPLPPPMVSPPITPSSFPPLSPPPPLGVAREVVDAESLQTLARQVVDRYPSGFQGFPHWATDEHRYLWCEWVLARPADKPLSPISLRHAIGRLAKLGPARSIKALKNSLENAYSGIVEPKAGDENHQETPQELAERLAREMDEVLK